MEQEVRYIYDIPKFTGKSSQDNTKEYIKRLGAGCSSARIIHIAGTNGKGSVCAYTDSILRCAGYSVGVFTSPHLVDINERIKVDGKQISNEDFEMIFREARDVSRQMEHDGYVHPSFFEFLFGMAMKYFSVNNPDYIILETGLGGRLDATNIIDNPAVCVITSIGLDHVEYLGDTYEAIAAEKAGIIKQGTPVVWMRKRGDVAEVIKDAVRRQKAVSYMLSKDDIRILYADDKKIDFSLDNMYYCNERFTINTAALYQAENASLALTAAGVLGITDISCLKAGVAGAFWPGRMQEAAEDFFVDGAHNDDGIKAFLETVRNMGGKGSIIFFSAVRDKHYEGMISQICESGLFSECITAPLSDARGLESSVLKECFERGKMNVTACSNVEEGCKTAFSRISQGNKIYAAGSLYFAGEILRYIRRNIK